MVEEVEAYRNMRNYQKIYIHKSRNQNTEKIDPSKFELKFKRPNPLYMIVAPYPLLRVTFHDHNLSKFLVGT